MVSGAIEAMIVCNNDDVTSEVEAKVIGMLIFSGKGAGTFSFKAAADC